MAGDAATSAVVDGVADPEVGTSVTVAGVTTNYHDVGSGPPLLLLHGSGPGVTAWANWRGVIPDLARRFRVVAPDLLGFGRTLPRHDSTYRLATWVEHLSGFLDALGLPQTSVVGNSFGGALALRLATGQPQRVDRLVLMGSVGVDFPITAGLEQVWGFTPSWANMRRLLDLFAHDRTRVTDDLAELRLAAATRPGVHEAFTAMFPPPRQESVHALATDEQHIAALRHRTLILHGRDDRVIPLDTSLRLHHLIARSQLHVFGECGHWVQIEQHDGFVSLVSEFLNGTP